MGSIAIALTLSKIAKMVNPKNSAKSKRARAKARAKARATAPVEELTVATRLPDLPECPAFRLFPVEAGRGERVYFAARAGPAALQQYYDWLMADPTRIDWLNSRVQPHGVRIGIGGGCSDIGPGFVRRRNVGPSSIGRGSPTDEGPCTSTNRLEDDSVN